MLSIYYSGRKITLEPDTFEELEAVKKVAFQMEADGDIKVFDNGDFIVVFVVRKNLPTLEVVVDIKMRIEKLV